MSTKYKEYSQLDLSESASRMLSFWEENEIFAKSVENRRSNKPFVFYEGPPSANGLPGIHHVMSRAIKDIFCRYQTLKGRLVERKAGWDTHGLPVELGVEKELGITKEDIGTKISVEDYNKECRKAVMKYTDVWNQLTRQMGYWVDMDDPYVTYDNKYIESVWWLLRKLWDNDMLYKGYTIQPFSPKAGTGLSTHELNQPGTYRNVKDTTIVAQFKVFDEDKYQLLSKLSIAPKHPQNLYFIAWTTTPWTLPSNTALTVGKGIIYSVVETKNKYTNEYIIVILASALVDKHFPVAKDVEFRVLGEVEGSGLLGMRYEALLPYHKPVDDTSKSFTVIPGDFVTTEDGTGIVHTAPTFGADDARVAAAAGVPPLLILDDQGNKVPLVDTTGKFVQGMGKLSGRYVKDEYYDEGTAPQNSVDVDIAIDLKQRGMAFNVAKYEHTYPHCWRTDKPILYYPLDSWFVKATKSKDRMVELNNTINWKPASTGSGRFGNWLENLNDWNLSRSRFWGIPLPIWRTEENDEQICIGDITELKGQIDLSVKAGVMSSNPLLDFIPGSFDKANYSIFDLHKPYIDDVVLVSSTGKPMHRESDLIDVWFDSGSMPYAQWHYPFENKEKIDGGLAFPADFIAEGVDQTRGWFYTLHAIGTMCFDQVAYKAVVSNGLVLDKDGQKMSKRLGNAADPFITLDKYGPDATRWYMITNAQPWDNLKFDESGIVEVQRKFFGTLYNTYNFFALYANIDQFAFKEEAISAEQRPEIDRWILSKLNSLVVEVDEALGDFEPTKAGRAIQTFVVDQLSNWYVRLCRRRFWKGEYNSDKISAYQTLYTCLETVSIISSPIAPFFMDQLFQDLNSVKSSRHSESVHLADFPKVVNELIDVDLEERMQIAQRISSMVLSLRKKEGIRVRQPLRKIMVPVIDSKFERQLREVKDLILAEVNVKEIEYLKETAGVLVKNIKPNYKRLGPKFGKQMKEVANVISSFSQDDISNLETSGSWEFVVNGNQVVVELDDVEIAPQDIPGWLVASEGRYTVALDVEIDEELKLEGIARELINRIQNMRKDGGFEVTDKIDLTILKSPLITAAVEKNLDYICAETLAGNLSLVEDSVQGESIEIEEGLETKIYIEHNN
jgi:isoleucyl-tRNA synthetase